MNQIGPKSGKIAKNNQRKTTKQANFRVNKATFFCLSLSIHCSLWEFMQKADEGVYQKKTEPQKFENGKTH